METEHQITMMFRSSEEPIVRDATRLARLLFVLVLALPTVSGAGQAAARPEGRLTVVVTSGDPAAPTRDAFVFVRGYEPRYHGETLSQVRPTRDGWFEVSLPPGLYDVFISEGSCIPKCRRVAIEANKATLIKRSSPWTRNTLPRTRVDEINPKRICGIASIRRPRALPCRGTCDR